MNISRDLALEIFGLKDGFSKQNLDDSYRKLVKITHPDSGGNNTLFIFIRECKEVLEKSKKNTDNNPKNTKKSAAEYATEKKISDISLDLLYKEYHYLDEHMKDYSLRNVYTYAKVFIQPYFKRSLQQNFNITLVTPFQDFLNFSRSLVNFTETIYLPEEFRKFNLFKVSIIIQDKTFNFSILNDTFKKFTLDNWRFETILNLSFKNRKK